MCACVVRARVLCARACCARACVVRALFCLCLNMRERTHALVMHVLARHVSASVTASYVPVSVPKNIATPVIFITRQCYRVSLFSQHNYTWRRVGPSLLLGPHEILLPTPSAASATSLRREETMEMEEKDREAAFSNGQDGGKTGEDDPTTQCGLGSFHPPWLQHCTNMKSFTAVLSCVTVFGSINFRLA